MNGLASAIEVLYRLMIDTGSSAGDTLQSQPSFIHSTTLGHSFPHIHVNNCKMIPNQAI